MIDKASSRQVKTWRKLQQKKYRQSEGLFIAEGERCVEQILKNGYLEIEAIVCSETSRWNLQEALQTKRGLQNDAAAEMKKYPLYTVEDPVFDSLTDTRTTQGVAAVCRIPTERSLEELSEHAGVMIATDGVGDPGNLGTMIRTGVWFGATALICGSGTVDPWHPKVVRSTAGATGALPVIQEDLEEALMRLENREWSVLLLDGSKESMPLSQMEPSKRQVLVVGNEAHGISQSHFHDRRIAVRIPGNPETVESLNAAIALSLALYEIRR